MIEYKKELFDNGAGDYSIPRIALDEEPENCPDELKYLFTHNVVDDELGYLGHPDSVLLKNGDILTVFPSGHGKGAVRSKISHDGGLTYPDRIENMPVSWKNSRETPTIYRLEFSDGTPDKLLLVCGNPDWHDGVETTGGFNCSLSCDEGKSWSEFELFYGRNEGYEYITIVALASLTRLKENGKFVDKWMGLFHDGSFVNYKTVLSFENGRMHWSKPEPYLTEYRELEIKANICEVECVRSDGGKGDELCLITRSNSKLYNSLLIFSEDEGKTWSEPVLAPSALNGERHKADYLPDGRLFIDFRSIERDYDKMKKYAPDSRYNWFSEGWAAWIGTFDDLKNGREGQYRLKLAHTYLDGQTQPAVNADADTGYCGHVVLDDGTVVTATYGRFGELNEDGSRKTYVVSKRIKLSDIDKLYNKN